MVCSWDEAAVRLNTSNFLAKRSQEMILGWLLLHRSVAVKLIMEAVSEARLDALGDVWVLPNGGDGEEDQLLQLRRLQGSGATSNISMQRQRPWAQSSGNDLLKPLQKTADTALRQLYGEDTARVAEYEIDELDTSSPSSLDVSPFQAPEAPSPRANSTDRQTTHLTPSGTGQRPVETLKAQPPPAQTSQSPQRRSQDQGEVPVRLPSPRDTGVAFLDASRSSAYAKPASLRALPPDVEACTRWKAFETTMGAPAGRCQWEAVSPCMLFTQAAMEVQMSQGFKRRVRLCLPFNLWGGG